MSTKAPDHQHYINPLKGGWYYVADSDNALSGLMSKKQARKFVKKHYRGKYGYDVLRRPGSPKNCIMKFFTRP